MIQIRNVPEDVHRRAKARAALAGMTLSDFALRAIERTLDRPTRKQVLDRIAELAPARLDPPAADIIRAARETR